MVFQIQKYVSSKCWHFYIWMPFEEKTQFAHTVVNIIWFSSSELAQKAYLPDHITCKSRKVEIFFSPVVDELLPMTFWKVHIIATWIHQFWVVSVTRIRHGVFYFLQMLSQGNISQISDKENLVWLTFYNLSDTKDMGGKKEQKSILYYRQLKRLH